MYMLAPYYYPAYWLLTMLMTLNIFGKIYSQNKIIGVKYSYRPMILYSIFFILIFGFRPISKYFGDTVNYSHVYQLLQGFGVFDLEGTESVGSDWLFALLMKLCSHVMNVYFFLAIMTFLYISAMIKGCKMLDYWHGAMLMLFCIGAFEFYPFAVNGIRNGVACSLMIMSVAFLCQKKLFLALFFSFIAIGFHKSALLPAVCMFFTYYVSKPKLMFIAWLGAIVVSLTMGGYIDSLLSALSYDERLASNLQSDNADGIIMEHRFRWDFLLYSSMPIVLGWYTIFRRKLFNKTYLILLGTYIYANVFWVLAIRAIFSNRIAYLSWFIYPIVLSYPLFNFRVFNKNHNKKTAWILLSHFGLTTILWLLDKVH